MLQQALDSVVLVRVGQSWATGCVLSHTGLIVTNAHLLPQQQEQCIPQQKASTSISITGATAVNVLPNCVSVDRHHGTAAQCRSDATAARSSGCPSLGGATTISLHCADASTGSSNRTGCVDSSSVCANNSSSSIGSSSSISNISISSGSGSTSRNATSINSSSSTFTTPVQVRVAASHGGYIWLQARVLHRFTGYLDIAVLQLVMGGTPNSLLKPLRPIQLSRLTAAEPGLSPVFVVGHGLFGPSLGWAPSVTAGSLARVISLGCSSLKPSMLITTAAVHAGASGGAVVDSKGQLLGLVTSNARHAKGATLPHWNFCIAAAELAPLWDWAAKWGSRQGINTSTLPVQQALDLRGSSDALLKRGPLFDAQIMQQLLMLDIHDDVGERVWALKHPVPVQPAAPHVSAAERLAQKLNALKSGNIKGVDAHTAAEQKPSPVKACSAHDVGSSPRVAAARDEQWLPSRGAAACSVQQNGCVGTKHDMVDTSQVSHCSEAIAAAIRQQLRSVQMQSPQASVPSTLSKL